MLELSNIINVSVSLNPAGLGNFNINNLALFTKEVPLANDESSSSSSSGAGEYVPGPYGSYRAYASAAEVGADWGTDSETYQQAVAVFSQQPNILSGDGNLLIFTMGADETLAEAIDRAVDLVFFCGIISTDYPAPASFADLASQVQAYGDKIIFLPSSDSTAIAGAFTDIKSAKLTSARCLYYSTTALAARLFAAAYAGRGLSVDFDGSKTTLTMNLKTLSGITADPGITQTLYNACKTAGVDIYADISGIAAAASFGANKYFDEIYNLIWFVSQIKVTGFNALYLTSGKIPQTEEGMSYLKAAYRQVCEQAVNNGYIAPGIWTSPEWFGNPDDMAKNIEQRGYYIYSTPVNKQSTTDRAARKAPLVQIAVKEAGAFHSTDLAIFINP